MGVTMDDLVKLWREIYRPGPVAVWCIDRPAMLHRVRRACLEASGPVDQRFSGLRFYDWRSDSLEREYAAAVDLYGQERADMWRQNLPLFVKDGTPGVWVEMSDGNHYQIEAGDAQ